MINQTRAELFRICEDSRPAIVLCLPLYAARGEAGEPGTEPIDDVKDKSGGVAIDGGIV